MNKADLVNAVLKNLGNGTSRAQAERNVDAVIDSIRSGLKKDKNVQLVGFGTFRVADRKARIGVNPKTGEKIKIKASKTVKFAAGKDLKAKIGGR
jgi:DNA-binding protein HU-beta